MKLNISGFQEFNPILSGFNDKTLPEPDFKNHVVFLIFQ